MLGIIVSKKLTTPAVSVNVLSTMKMDVGDFSERLVPVHLTTHCHNLEDRNLNTSRRMNLKSALGMSERNLITSQRKVDSWLLMELQSTAVISACP
jgi:hypothetical protein